MNRLLARGIAVGIGLTAAGAAPAVSQDRAAKPAEPDRPAILKVATGIMHRARFCALITLRADGHPQSRIVDAFEPGADMTVWIATNPATRKVAEIRKDPRVALSYFDPNSMGYVTLVGRAAIVTDAAEKAKRWKDEWAALYKDKNRGDDYVLIKVTPLRLEVSAEGEGVKNDPKTWRPVIVEFK